LKADFNVCLKFNKKSFARSRIPRQTAQNRLTFKNSQIPNQKKAGAILAFFIYQPLKSRANYRGAAQSPPRLMTPDSFSGCFSFF